MIVVGDEGERELKPKGSEGCFNKQLAHQSISIGVKVFQTLVGVYHW